MPTSQAYVARFVLAGVEVRNLVALQTCNFTDGASLPACLKGKFGGANETVTASNGADEYVLRPRPCTGLHRVAVHMDGRPAVLQLLVCMWPAMLYGC